MWTQPVCFIVTNLYSQMKFVEAWLTLGLYQAADQVERDGQHDTSDDRNVQVKEEVECD
jgi:hypothetical protein